MLNKYIFLISYLRSHSVRWQIQYCFLLPKVLLPETHSWEGTLFWSRRAFASGEDGRGAVGARADLQAVVISCLDN